VETYLVYYVDEFLGILSREMLDHLYLIIAREDGHYQRGALVRRKGIIDQPFPGWRVTTDEDPVNLTNG
jgi:hypothetical protein